MNEAVRAEGASQVRTVGARPPRLSPLARVPEIQPRAVAEQDVVVLPAVVNLSIYEGDDFWMDIVITDTNNNPVDLTGTFPTSQIRPAPDDETILANFDVSVDVPSGGTTVNLIHLHLNADDSNLLPASAAWDVQLTTPNITTIAGGTVTVTPQVTQ
jgi:hypothetical protein